MKLTRNEINAVASAALSGVWPPTAKFYHDFFNLPFGRAMALERHRFGKADIRRIRGALLRAGANTANMTVNPIRTMAMARIIGSAWRQPKGASL